MDEDQLQEVLNEQADFLSVPDIGTARSIPGINETPSAGKPDKPTLEHKNTPAKDDDIGNTSAVSGNLDTAEEEADQGINEVRQSIQQEIGEEPRRAEIEKRVKVGSEFLSRLDEVAEHVTVDETTGKIDFTGFSDTKVLSPDAQEYGQKFDALRVKFRPKTEAYAKRLQEVPGIMDVRVVLGAIVVTYDSSVKKPEFEGLFSPNDERGWHKSTRPDFLGLAVINISKAERTDGVSPTTSAVHELQHHTRYMSDYLLSQDPILRMQSVMVDGRNEALFGEAHRTIFTNQLYENDVGQYKVILGRKFDANELRNVQLQQRYLDELHSSYLQRKDEWFKGEGKVYSNVQKGKHHELVGQNQEDMQAATEMLGFMQGFYTLDRLQQAWSQLLVQDPSKVGPIMRQFTADSPSMYRDVGALIGASRTVSQARRLVGAKWNEFMDKYQKITTHPQFTWYMDQWEGAIGQKGAGVDGLRGLLLGSTSQ